MLDGEIPAYYEVPVRRPPIAHLPEPSSLIEEEAKEEAKEEVKEDTKT